ncbi:MAG: protease modulator HflC [Acidobacteriota bacterium]
MSKSTDASASSSSSSGFSWRWLLLLPLALVVWSSLYTVEEGQVAVVTRFGQPLDDLAGPGLHAKLPWPVDSALRVDQRLLIFDNEPTEMLTGDKKNIVVDSFVCWRIADPLRFVQTVKTRPEAEARLLDLVTAELGAAVGAEPMDSFINTDAEKVRLAQVAQATGRKVDEVTRASFGIEVVDLAINGFNLPAQNRVSVIERMRAERRRIATAYRSEGEEEALKIEAEAQAERERLLAQARSSAEAARGGGEARALEILADAYRQDPQLYRFLRSLESYETLFDEDTTIFLPADAPLLEALDGP